jgi:putative membrane protein
MKLGGAGTVMMDGGAGWWWMGGGSLLFILVIGLVTWVLIRQAHQSPQSPQATTPPVRTRERSAEDVLAERYARGEIDKEQYESRRDVLRS